MYNVFVSAFTTGYELLTTYSLMATIDEFHNIEMKIGTVVSAERIEGADKLIKLKVDFNEEGGPRAIVSGIAEFYAPDDLVGRQFPFVTNLPPRMLRGVESQGMILALKTPDGMALLNPDKEVPPGSPLS